MKNEVKKILKNPNKFKQTIIQAQLVVFPWPHIILMTFQKYDLFPTIEKSINTNYLYIFIGKYTFEFDTSNNQTL